MIANWKSLLAFTALTASAALAKPCVGFDSDFNLYVFGGTTDYALGPQDSWFNGSEQFPFFCFDRDRDCAGARSGGSAPARLAGG